MAKQEAESSMTFLERLLPQERLLSPEPEVTLLGRVQALDEDLSPEELDEISSSIVFAGESARSCYSSTLFTPADYLRSAHRRKTDEVIESTRESGHLTTRQHMHFVFGLEQVSRAAIWVLHGHPFYNSEQQSQRYVTVKDGNNLIPDLPPEALEVYSQTVERQMAAYHQLVEVLTPVVDQEYFRIFPGRKKNSEKYSGEVQKKAQEVARYALPIATHTLLYHTVSALTLMRYVRTCEWHDVPTETRILIGRMVEAVAKVDPRFLGELHDPIPLDQTPEFAVLTNLRGEVNFEAAQGFVTEFDNNLDGRISRLVGFMPRAPWVLANGVRAVLGLSRDRLSDVGAIAIAMDPAKNRLLGDVFNVTTMNKPSRAMELVSYTFAKKISHTADSQDQRHRMVPGARPVLATQYTGQPDYITPALVKDSPEAQKLYQAVMIDTFTAINQLLAMGVSWEKASYLLPNAFPIRFLESGSLLNLHHKDKMRLCFNAQEEIWNASLEEAQQIEEVHPEIGKWLGPPCEIRKQACMTPYCPEGERYCGVPVWKLSKDQYKRLV